uniref:Alkylglycerone-phosphate synthase n=1 Tax=Romanomermis culicivorax TaxID=13658 RepID=A0A915HWE0_ROMCU
MQCWRLLCVVPGQALKFSSSFFTSINDFLERLYVTHWKRFDANKMAPATIVFEGNKQEVEMQEKRVYSICGKYDGFPAGEENGRHGYQLTFLVAHIRDVAMNYMAIGESFETSVPWDCYTIIKLFIFSVIRLYNNVKKLCRRECSRLGVRHPPLVSCRLTQLYDAGACIYFYFGFNYRDLQHNENDDDRSLLEKALHVYEQIEYFISSFLNMGLPICSPLRVIAKLRQRRHSKMGAKVAAREEILACGGSVSHHHGVGKLRKRWLSRTVGDVGLGALLAVKNHLDPKNVFANGNLFNVSKL